jgi:hypothetical protein
MKIAFIFRGFSQSLWRRGVPSLSETTTRRLLARPLIVDPPLLRPISRNAGPLFLFRLGRGTAISAGKSPRLAVVAQREGISPKLFVVSQKDLTRLYRPEPQSELSNACLI